MATNEAFSRTLIDAQLGDAGWKILRVKIVVAQQIAALATAQATFDALLHQAFA